MPATPGSLYIAGFAQVGQPHAAILLATSTQHGKIGHIVSRNGPWVYHFDSRKIENSVAMTSLLTIRDASKGVVTNEMLDELLRRVPVPPGDVHGECLNWVIDAVKLLADEGYMTLTSADSLKEEFSAFCTENRRYASTSQYPNMKKSDYCS